MMDYDKIKNTITIDELIAEMEKDHEVAKGLAIARANLAVELEKNPDYWKDNVEIERFNFSAEAWDNKELGASEKYAKRVSKEKENEIMDVLKPRGDVAMVGAKM